MHFEHIVQVNDRADPRILSLTRDQLWRGLVRRAREPLEFVVGLDSFKILQDLGSELRRRLVFPGITVEDVVRFEEPDRICYEIIANQLIGTGSLMMQIEEPEAGDLFVRFVYCTHPADASGEASPYDAFTQQAYRAMDIDTIRLIRDREARR